MLNISGFALIRFMASVIKVFLFFREVDSAPEYGMRAFVPQSAIPRNRESIKTPDAADSAVRLAKALRKIQDLQITNASLVAINASLEGLCQATLSEKDSHSEELNLERSIDEINNMLVDAIQSADRAFGKSDKRTVYYSQFSAEECSKTYIQPGNSID